MGMLLIGWRSTWFIGGLVVIVGAVFAVRVYPRAWPTPRWNIPSPVRTKAEAIHCCCGRTSVCGSPCRSCWPRHSSQPDFSSIRLTWCRKGLVADLVCNMLCRLRGGACVLRTLAIRTRHRQVWNTADSPVLRWLPLSLSLAVLAFLSNRYSVPLYLTAMGVASGTTSVMATSLWVELYGAQQLARVRSSVAAADVEVASGLSPPFAMGWLIDFGVPLSKQAIVCLGGLIVVSLLSRRVGSLVGDHAKYVAQPVTNAM